MSNAISSHLFNNVTVRTTIDEHGAVWFVAADVCAALDIGGTSAAVSRLDDDEKGGTSIVDTAGGEQSMLTISESGMYSLVLTSRKPDSKRFKRWVTHEALPAIRKAGRHNTAPSAPTPAPTPAPQLPPPLPGSAADKIAACLMLCDYVAKVPGLLPERLAAQALAFIQDNTGLSTRELARCLSGTGPKVLPARAGMSLDTNGA